MKYAKRLVLFVAGLIVFWSQEKVRFWLQGPEITTKPQALVLLKVRNDLWRVLLDARISNTGQSAVTVEVSDFYLQYSQLGDRQVFFKIDRSISVPAYVTVRDTLVAQFTGLFHEGTKLDEFPTFSKGGFRLLSPNGSLLASAEFDSSDVAQRTMFESGEAKTVQDFPGTTYNQRTAQLGFPVTLLPVTYKGQVYKVLIYPPTVSATYSIVNERIRLEFSSALASTTGGLDQYIAPIKVFPDSAIADKVDLAEYWKLNLMMETRSNKAITFDSHELLIGNLQDFMEQYIYIFK